MKKVLLLFLCFYTLLPAAVARPKSVADSDTPEQSSYSWVLDSLKKIELLNVGIKDPLHCTATVRLDYNNPKIGFEISDVKADFLIDSQKCFQVSCSNIIAIKKKCRDCYLADVDIEFSPYVNAFSLLNVLKSRYKPHLFLNASFKLSMRGGAGVVIKGEYSLDDVFNPDELCASFVKGDGFSKLNGIASVKPVSFDILYIDECGLNGFTALLELEMTTKLLNCITTEMSIVGDVYFSGKKAFSVESVYDLDLKGGTRKYYILVNGEKDADFNPCTFLNLLKNDCRDTISIKLSRPRALKGEKILYAPDAQ